MKPPLFSRFLDKSCAAMIAGIEIYNKPHFAYREESFAILAINAWELLLKARILQINNNRPRSLYVYETRIKNDGSKTSKLYIKYNRSGNPMTIGLMAAMAKIENAANSNLPVNVRRNLEALLEVRDNASHYINVSPRLSNEILEVATAAIQNCFIVIHSWFHRDLSDSISLFLPLGFMRGASELSAVAVSPNEKRLLAYLHELAAESTDGDEDEPYHVAVRVDVRLERSQLEGALKIAHSDDPDAVKVNVTEEQIRQKYPWDYNELISRLKRRYADFKLNNTFHQIRKPLMSDERFVKRRLLDPARPKGIKKDFYNPNIVREFDKHYKTN